MDTRNITIMLKSSFWYSFENGNEECVATIDFDKVPASGPEYLGLACKVYEGQSLDGLVVVGKNKDDRYVHAMRLISVLCDSALQRRYIAENNLVDSEIEVAKQLKENALQLAQVYQTKKKRTAIQKEKIAQVVKFYKSQATDKARPLALLRVVAEEYLFFQSQNPQTKKPCAAEELAKGTPAVPAAGMSGRI